MELVAEEFANLSQIMKLILKHKTYKRHKTTVQIKQSTENLKLSKAF